MTTLFRSPHLSWSTFGVNVLRYLFFPLLALLRLTTTDMASSVTFRSNYQDAIDLWGYADEGSYLQAGYHLYSNGNLEGFYWVINLWSPGNVFLNYLSLQLSGPLGSQFLVARFVIMLPLCLLLGHLIFTHSKDGWSLRGLLRAVLGSVTVWASYGQLFPKADSVALMALVCAVATLTMYSVDSIKGTLMVALLLLISIYFRAQFIFLPHFLLIGMALAISSSVAIEYRRQARKRSTVFVVPTRILDVLFRRIKSFRHVTLLACLVSLGMLPWLQWRETRFPDAHSDVGFGLTWQVADQVMAPVQVQPPELQPAFVRDAGGDVFCRFQRKLCELVSESESRASSPWNIYDSEGFSNEEMKDFVVGAVASNFAEVLRYKAGVTMRLVWDGGSILDVPFMLFLLSLLVISVSFRWAVFRLLLGKGKLDLRLTIILVYLLATTSYTILLGHLELRYLLPLMLGNPLLWLRDRTSFR